VKCYEPTLTCIISAENTLPVHKIALGTVQKQFLLFWSKQVAFFNDEQIGPSSLKFKILKTLYSDIFMQAPQI